MGFSSVAAQIIMFITAISTATTMIVAFNSYTNEANEALTIKREVMTNSLRTDFTITSIVYDDDLDQLYILLLNTGDTELTLNLTDVLVGGEFIPRNENKTLSIVPTTEMRNPVIWDPDEVLNITVNKTLATGQSYILDVITQYGTRETERFST